MDTLIDFESPARPQALQGSLTRRIDGFLRRTLDIAAAFVGLLCLLPFFAVIAFLIRRDSPGPILYCGARTGKGGCTFQMLKFRTMYERPESYRGPRITANGDGRVTPLGRWLRATKLNELPQLWNVLRGEMSLVGPRPEDPEIAAAWSPQIRRELLAVRPGITSPASILYRGEEKMLSAGSLMEDYLRDVLPGKLRLDCLYLRQRTLLSDLDILFLTLVTLLPRLRKRSIPRLGRQKDQLVGLPSSAVSAVETPAVAEGLEQIDHLLTSGDLPSARLRLSELRLQYKEVPERLEVG